MQLQVFESGEEPLVAASVMELFLLLPGASQYVEDLVRVTLQLESVMYKYNPESSSSPFRKPLASFLNKHYSSESFHLFITTMLCLDVSLLLLTLTASISIEMNRGCRVLLGRAPTV